MLPACFFIFRCLAPSTTTTTGVTLLANHRLGGSNVTKCLMYVEHEVLVRTFKPSCDGQLALAVVLAFFLGKAPTSRRLILCMRYSQRTNVSFISQKIS